MKMRRALALLGLGAIAATAFAPTASADVFKDGLWLELRSGGGAIPAPTTMPQWDSLYPGFCSPMNGQ